MRSVHLQDAAHPDPGLYVASALVPKVDSTEWGDVKAPEYNNLPPRLAYGIAGRAGSFKDPILYSSSYRYTVDKENLTISVPGLPMIEPARLLRENYFSVSKYKIVDSTFTTPFKHFFIRNRYSRL